MRALPLMLALVVLGGSASAQVLSRPTDPPLVTAVNESWYLSREPILFAGDLYYPAGAQVFFNGNRMVRTGYYNGVPIFTDTTIEPFSILLVPVSRGLMQPYERRRQGLLAGTTGSRAPSFPVQVTPYETSLPLTYAAGGLPLANSGALPLTYSGALPLAYAGALPLGYAGALQFGYPGGLPLGWAGTLPLMGYAGTLPVAPSAPTGLPVFAPEPLLPVVPTTAAPQPSAGLTTPSAAVPPADTRGVVSLRVPENNDGIWIRFRDQRWVSAGRAQPLLGGFVQIGDHAGFPVYARPGDTEMIYVATGTGLIAPYRLKE